MKMTTETSEEVSVRRGWEEKSSIVVLHWDHRGYLEEHVDTS